jgi:CubicO group peptidase (beta-lactamase class C family)
MHAAETATAVGLDPSRWQAALDLIRGWCDAGQVPAAAVVVTRSGKSAGVHRFGRQGLVADSPPVRDDAIFLIASITKPIVATGALLLVERGLIALDDRVEQYIPPFGREGKHAVTIRHLLTHTSGLPDMLPNNVELRTARAPLSEFVIETCKCGLDFLPGRGVQYQSMGFAILGEIIRVVIGQSCAQFLEDELFKPLGMNDTSLGAPDDWFAGPRPKVDRIVELRLPPDSEQARESSRDWNWNSSYWRKLGAPWGGLLTTPADLSRFGQMMLAEGRSGDRQIVSRAAIQAATRNQLEAMRDVPADDRRTRPWGLGWRLNWGAHSANFGDFLGPRTYGHWGATGTVMWLDPDRDACVILLTTKPQEPQGTYLARASNAIVAAMV